MTIDQANMDAMKKQLEEIAEDITNDFLLSTVSPADFVATLDTTDLPALVLYSTDAQLKQAARVERMERNKSK